MKRAGAVPAPASIPMTHLFIDGRNSAYRAIYANQSSNGVRCHDLVVMIRFMHTWLDIHKPDHIHVFWDAPRHTVWRRQILPKYKDRPPSKSLPDRDIRAELGQLQDAAWEIFEGMGIRQYSKATMEADDLIYAACRVVGDEPVIIVSSDGDFTQIAYAMPHVSVYEPKLNKMLERPTHNPVLRKALWGDESDCIDGYAGIGEVKSLAMAKSIVDMYKFLDGAGRRDFIENLILIDLGLCPYLLHNQLYVSRVLVKPAPVYNRDSIMAAGTKHKVGGLLPEYDRIILPFKRLSKTC